MKKVLLISEQQIKNYSVIDQNVDSKILGKITVNVQETQLKPILGGVLYTSIIDAVHEFVTNNTALEASMATLLNDYIQPYLAYAIQVEYLVFGNYKITNKGVLKLRDDVAESVSAEELEYFKNYADNYLTVRKANLVQYLQDNDLLPTDKPTDTDTSSASIGWFLQ